jgi:hypothetical protein
MTRARLLMLCVAVLLVAGGLTFSVAYGSETEAPYWSVEGSRLATGVPKSASITSVAEVVINGEISGEKMTIKCAKGALGEAGAASIEDPAEKHDGKMSGKLTLSSCELYVAEKLVSECKIPEIKSGTLDGKLWLEGKKSETTISVLDLEPKEMTEGKPVIASITMEGASCKYKSTTFKLEGSLVADMLPENEEFTYIQWVFPTTPDTKGWDAEGEETFAGLKFGGAPATLVGEMKVELVSKERFGVGLGPRVGIEAPFWTVGGKRLEPGEVRPIKETTSTITLFSTIKGEKIKIVCTGSQLKEAQLEGSLNQRDGKIIGVLEFSKCKLYAFEGGVYKEKPECEIPTFSTNKLHGRLWFEGTKAERKTKSVIVLEPPIGSNVIAEFSIKGGTCKFAGKYKLLGFIVIRMIPENETAKDVTFVYPLSPPTAVWQSAEQQAEMKITLELEEESGTKNITSDEGEQPIELTGKESFGSGTHIQC